MGLETGSSGADEEGGTVRGRHGVHGAPTVVPANEAVLGVSAPLRC
jgi:hypothetical protein